MQAALAARNVTHFDAFRVLGERACWSEPPHLPRAIARVNAAAQPNTGGEICKQNTRNLQAIFDVRLSCPMTVILSSVPLILCPCG